MCFSYECKRATDDFYANLDPFFHSDADLDPDPASNQCFTNLWKTYPPRVHFESPRLHCERPRPSIHGSISSFSSSWIVTLIRIRIQLFTLMWIRSLFSKTMWIHADPDLQHWFAGLEHYGADESDRKVPYSLYASLVEFISTLVNSKAFFNMQYSFKV